jgi:hypothetical protein
MTAIDLLLPVFVHVALTFGLLLAVARTRVAALRRGQVKMADIALDPSRFPERPRQIANAYQNQLELPLLFYTLVAMAIATRKIDIVLVLLAWLFVALRLLHAAVHVTSNRVPLRFQAFAAGFAVLIAMWLWFATRFLTGT